MLGPLSLACLAMTLLLTLLPAPAFAGHWVLKLDGSSGSASVNGGTPVPYTPPAGTVSLNPITVIGPSASSWFSGPYSFGTPPTYSATATLTIVLTGTWTADTNSDNTPPPTLMFGVSSSADGYSATNGGPLQAGQANDGFGDPFDPKAQYPGTSDTQAARFKSLDPKTLSLTLTLTASATGGTGARGGGGVNASIGTVTLGIHAQPYNFHKISQTDNHDGTISFVYDWLSTTGNKADLTSCYSHERVTYPGATRAGSYFPPSCFANSIGLDNPTVLPRLDTSSMASGNGYDTHYTWTVSPFYIYTTVTAAQRYEFNDTLTGETNVLIPGPDSTASIVRTVSQLSSFIDWWYSVTKQGLTGSKKLP